MPKFVIKDGKRVQVHPPMDVPVSRQARPAKPTTPVPVPEPAPLPSSGEDK